MQREQKITLGEMRESGPTRLIVYCADYKCGIQSWSTPAAGAMTSACPIWSRDLPVRFAAIGRPTSGRCSSTRAWRPVSLRQGDGLVACGTSRPGHRGPDYQAWQDQQDWTERRVKTGPQLWRSY
jgi:hypothetical protein